ncbi:MAG: xylulokinase [Clostridiales bacterium]|nr:xylulokinase [Clostridiales bacterium]
MLFIGIDLGTSAVKLLLSDESGKVLKTVTKTYDVFFPKNGWSEQNPEDWYTQSVQGLKELIADCDKSDVKGISFGGQMHGLVILDSEDKVIRNALLWNDGRSAEESDWLNKEIGMDVLTRETGNISFAGFTASKVLWVKNHEPENFAKIKKIMLPKDYLAYRMTGVFSTDVSDASGTLYFDVKNRTWSDHMLSILGISKEQLPKIFESYEVTGKVLPALAAELGIGEDVVVAAGAGDNAAAAVGMGIAGKSGKCNISLGTSGTVFISTDRFGECEGNALHAFSHADGKWHLMGCMLSAASCNKWWMDILQSEDFAGEQKDIKDLGENRVYFLPYLMGERSPINDSDARAAFIGMSMDTPRVILTQSVFEGVAFALKDSFLAAEKAGFTIESATVCGGGAKSPLWRKIIANVLGISLEKTVNEEGPAYGGAILAMVAAGVYPDVKTACETLIKPEVCEVPDPELTKLYAARYEEYKKLYPALKSVFKDIAAGRE